MSKGDTWETPDDLFESIDQHFSFELDACANYDNAKLGTYFTEEEDALKQDWWPYKSVWMNPPYSRGNIGRFMEKALSESRKGCTVVCLVRLDPTAGWFKKYVWGKAEAVLALGKRVRFKGADSAYPFPSCLVVYTPTEEEKVKTYFDIWEKW
jgi:site-specific DNA-methyltransferase (adenine-specific)